MPSVYLDGVELAEQCTRVVIRATGPFTETCAFCGGSTFEIKRIRITSTRMTLTISAWCVTCGMVADLPYHYPPAWHERLMKRLGQSFH